MYVKIFINGYRIARDPLKAEYTNFCVELIVNGKKYEFEKRYSEFEELHRRIKKIMTVPAFPPKRFLNKKTKVIEDRMESLQAYLQGVLLEDNGWEVLGAFFGLPLHVGEEDSFHSDTQPIRMYTSDPYLPSAIGESARGVGESSESTILDGVRMALYGGAGGDNSNSDGD